MEGENMNLKVLIALALKYWYLYLIIPILSLIAGYYYLQFTVPMYSASTALLIKDEEKSGQLDEEAIFSELGLTSKNKNLENEQIALRSTPLLDEVAANLQLQYTYSSIDRFGRRTLYGRTPIEVVNWVPVSEDSWLIAIIDFTDDGKFRLTIENEKYDETAVYPVIEHRGEFGKTMDLPMGKLTLARKMEYALNGPIALNVSSVHRIAKSIQKGLEAEIVGEESSVLTLKAIDPSGKRAADILTELYNVYNARSVEEKNLVFENTIDLINERIEMISTELEQTEQNVENYKISRGMFDMSAQGTNLLTSVTELNKEISNYDVQLDIMNRIEDFLIKNKENFEFVPTNLTLNNLMLSKQLETFNTLLANRATQRARLGPSHKELLLTEDQIRNLRQSIIDNISSIRGDLQITRNAGAERRDDIDTQLRSLPRRERELIEIQREKSIQENLYLYLLQKREESYISMAITTPNAKLIEPAEMDPNPVSPNRRLIWISALFLGIAFPTGIVLLLEILNDKIKTEEDIQKLTPVPVNGAIGVSRKKDSIVVHENRKTAIAEMFRLLRANLAYIAPGIDLRTLLITSSTSGEGKSFIARNLSVSQALAGKRVVLIDLDLRKPTQDKEMPDAASGKSADSNLGVVNYLVDHAILEKQIISQSGIHENLDLIAAGPIPPNPSELILSMRLRNLIEFLREEYDFIVVDSPPVGLVADALQMKDFVDATMYVTRSGYTRKTQIKIIDDIAEKDKLPRPFIVINALPYNQGNYYGGYGNPYVYGSKGDRNYYQKET